MKNRLALILVLCISLSMIGCGSTNTMNDTENVVSTEFKESKNVEETKENEEPKYTEYEDYFLQDGIDDKGNQYDMSTMELGSKNYTLTKSVDLYYLNENKCGYTKENIDIQVITSNDDYCYVILDHKYFLMKTKDIEDAKLEEETETNDTQVKESEPTSSNTTKDTTKKDTSTKQDTTSTKNENANTNNNISNTAKEEQSTNSEPKVEETQPQEQPTTSNKYTPEEAIAYYRSQVEAQGMQWDPSIKEGASWGSGWIPLSKDELNDSWIANEMAGYKYGDGVGNWSPNYYLEVTGSDNDNVYVTIWNN